MSANIKAGPATPVGEGPGRRRDPGKCLPLDGEVELLARTLYGEARGETVRGKEAVACVIVNRVRRARERGGYWWGESLGQVCQKPWQFSCWNEGDPNLKKILAVTPENRVFQSCIRIARRAASGAIDDPTRGATHYHSKSVNPPWSRAKAPTAEIGNHLFYTNIE
ncbi:MAG: cell wall hydrolase [Rhodospirillaceae bacterium]|nr:cell wall hydrolase [Rhodospirillaceae bacterium]MBL6941286.1 cell wall hydrolase [Rhodospirillales bacterium]